MNERHFESAYTDPYLSMCVVVQLLHQLCTITQTFPLELIHGTERNGMELWSKTPNSVRTLQVV